MKRNFFAIPPGAEVDDRVIAALVAAALAFAAPVAAQQAAEKAATIGMTPDQARALAQGIIAAAKKAEAHQ